MLPRSSIFQLFAVDGLVTPVTLLFYSQ